MIFPILILNKFFQFLHLLELKRKEKFLTYLSWVTPKDDGAMRKTVHVRLLVHIGFFPSSSDVFILKGYHVLSF
jgi:hypothetical protein